MTEPESERNGTVPRCRGCSAELRPGARRCGVCGALQKDDVKCPHCGGVAPEEPDDELRFVCAICGGPRIPLEDSSLRRTGRELAPLARAEAARRARAGWRAAAVATGMLLPMLLVVVGVLALLFGPGKGLAVAGSLVVAPVAAFSAWAWSRSKARGRDLSAALDQAWIAAAADVARQAQSPITPRHLARALHVGEAQAEELLVLLNAEDIVRADVTETGDLAYRPSLRIGDVGDGDESAGEAGETRRGSAAKRVARPRDEGSPDDAAAVDEDEAALAEAAEAEAGSAEAASGPTREGRR